MNKLGYGLQTILLRINSLGLKSLAILTIIFLGLGISSCRVDNPAHDYSSVGYHYLGEKMKPYQFRTNSYWVFENDTTGMLDSIVVTGTETGFYSDPPPVPGQRDYKYEFYKINLKSFATSLTWNDYLTIYFIKRNGGGDNGQYGQPIHTPVFDSGAGAGGMKIIARLPSMIIDSNSFNNVFKIKITAANQFQPEFAYDTYLYFTDTIGLIKKETDLGNGAIESWSIKRWNVIK